MGRQQHLAEYDESHLLVKQEVMPDGKTKLILKEKAGGRIVADSDPGAEYQETINKAAALMRAVEAAERLHDGVIPAGRR